jgi:hypothetical protein
MAKCFNRQSLKKSHMEFHNHIFFQAQLEMIFLSIQNQMIKAEIFQLWISFISKKRANQKFMSSLKSLFKNMNRKNLHIVHQI